MARARKTGQPTRIQREKRALIFDAALNVFSERGFSGATLDQIAEAAGLSKSNIVYYFDSKDTIYQELLASLLDTWIDPLRQISATGDPMEELLAYIRRKLEMSAELPRESRLFATEILQGAPVAQDRLSGPLKTLVDEKAGIISGWSATGRIADVDPYHLFFSIWAMTQHYADFDVQVQAVLGPVRSKTRFADAERYLIALFQTRLAP